MNTTPAERLRTLRAECNLHIADVAHCLGLTPEAMKRIELGAQKPSLDQTFELLAVLGTTIEALFGSEIELARADVAARLSGYRPAKGHPETTPERLVALRRLRSDLNHLHGGDR